MTSDPIVVTSRSVTRLVRAHELLRTVRRMPLASLAVLMVFIICAIIPDLLSPHDPLQNHLADSRLPPSFMGGGDQRYLLGTDLLGRDILSRTIRGAQVSLGLGFVTITIAAVVGTLIGMVAGLHGGWVDAVTMRIVDGFLAIPLILIALVFSVTVGPGFWTVVIVISLFLWARYARQVRGEVLSIVERDYVALARVAGASNWRLMSVHILPNVMGTVVVLSTLQVAYVIIIEATLSFLGAGVPPPAPTWGGMVADGQLFLREAWWMSTVPGLALALVVLSVNLLGDWLRDALDPTLRQL